MFRVEKEDNELAAAHSASLIPYSQPVAYSAISEVSPNWAQTAQLQRWQPLYQHVYAVFTQELGTEVRDQAQLLTEQIARLDPPGVEIIHNILEYAGIHRATLDVFKAVMEQNTFYRDLKDESPTYKLAKTQRDNAALAPFNYLFKSPRPAFPERNRLIHADSSPTSVGMSVGPPIHSARVINLDAAALATGTTPYVPSPHYRMVPDNVRIVTDQTMANKAFAATRNKSFLSTDEGKILAGYADLHIGSRPAMETTDGQDAEEAVDANDDDDSLPDLMFSMD